MNHKQTTIFGFRSVKVNVFNTTGHNANVANCVDLDESARINKLSREDPEFTTLYDSEKHTLSGEWADH